MKFDLIKPCKNCPFRTDDARIKFACRERAEEIEEIAYRRGFACHQHAELYDEDGDESHYDFREDGTTQHCFGALYMYVRNGDGNIPWLEAIEEDEELEERWWSRIEISAVEDLVFESEDAFLEANDG